MKIQVVIMYTLVGALFILIRSDPVISAQISTVGIMGQLLLGFFVVAMPSLYLLEYRSRKDPDKLFQKWKKKTETAAQKRNKQTFPLLPRQE